MRGVNMPKSLRATFTGLVIFTIGAYVENPPTPTILRNHVAR